MFALIAADSSWSICVSNIKPEVHLKTLCETFFKMFSWKSVLYFVQKKTKRNAEETVLMEAVLRYVHYSTTFRNSVPLLLYLSMNLNSHWILSKYPYK